MPKYNIFTLLLLYLYYNWKNNLYVVISCMLCLLFQPFTECSFEKPMSCCLFDILPIIINMLGCNNNHGKRKSKQTHSIWANEKA